MKIVSERPNKPVRVEPRKVPFQISPEMMKGVALKKGGPRAIGGDVAIFPLSEPSLEQDLETIVYDQPK